MIACVIFDMDGTLFDSETLCNRAFLDTIPAITAPLDILVQEFSGRKLAWIFGYIEERFDCVLPSNIEDIYRGRVAELFETDLRAFSGVKEALEGLQVPFCIATSAPITKVQHALGLTGLSDFFVGNIFSSYDIGSWKPEPEIFLHAAREMGHSPPDCLVIEDSQAGIIAANSANMRVVQFCGEAGTPLIEDYFRSYDKFNALLAEN